MMDSFPEHERLAEIQHKSQAIGEFVDWLKGKGIFLCDRWQGSVEDLEALAGEPLGNGFEDLFFKIIEGQKRFRRIDTPIIRLLEEFFEIDPDKIEQEKLQMLEILRQHRQ